jgi:hypothetical protein
MNKKGQDGIYIAFFLFMIIATIVFVVLCIFGLHVEDNTGSQVGYITTIDTNGIIFKTKSVYIKSNLESSQEERYCAEGEDVIANLTLARDNSSKVKIYYNDWIFRGITHCKSEDIDIIRAVEVLK